MVCVGSSHYHYVLILSKKKNLIKKENSYDQFLIRYAVYEFTSLKRQHICCFSEAFLTALVYVKRLKIKM